MEMAAYPAYDAYSQREWVGNSKLPSHWKVKALKRGAQIVLGKMLCPKNKGGYHLRPYLKSKNIQWLSVETDDVEEMWFSDEELKKFRLTKHDLLLSEGGEVGKTCIWNEEIDECYIQNSVHKVTVHEPNEPRYFLYQMYAMGKHGSFDEAVNRVSIAHLTFEKLSNIEFVFPPEHEQRAIAAFLDEKCAGVDEAVRIKEQQIALLQERRQILIQHAVTRGLNPAAPLKDSGIDWIGPIPAHWEVVRFKYLFTQSRLPVRKDDGVVTSYRDGQVTLRANRRMDGYTEAILEGGYQGIRAGQLVLNSMDAFEGAIGVSDSDGKCTPEYVICDPIDANINQYYLAYLLREMALADYIEVICNAVRQRAVRIRFNNLATRFMVLPPPVEQAEIVAFIEREKSRIADAIAIKEEQITALKEYKTSLINAAVTGKIKVI